MTSTWEAFPISLIESMAAGNAYISTNVGIVKYLPGGKICEEENELVQSISSLIDGKWSQLAEKGHEYAVKNFSQIDQVKKLEEVLMSN